MVDNPELQALYTLLASTVDGYNRTHSVQIDSIDFNAVVPVPFDDDSEDYIGSIVYRTYRTNVLDYYYEAIPKCELFPWTDQSEDPENVARIKDYMRREAQRSYREGWERLPWWIEIKEEANGCW